MNRSLVLAALLGLTGLAGCKKQAQQTQTKPECESTADCTGGLVCTNNKCTACSRDRECARDQFCHPIDRRCELMPCFGHDCKLNDDCKLGQFCVQGLCIAPLPAGASVTPDTCTVTTCPDGMTCPKGDRCNTTNLVCEQDLGCSADSDCASTELCNTANGECVAKCTPDTATQVCGLTAACKDGRCVDCLSDADCGAGYSCDLNSNTCVNPNACKTDRDCTIPLVCNPLTSSCTVKPGGCLSAEDCKSDQTCQLQTGTCIPKACLPDAYDPNDSMDSAKEVAVGSISNLTLCLEGTNPGVDYFKIPLRAGDQLDVFVDVDPLLHFDISILDPTGSVMSESDFATSAIVSLDGEYFIRATTTDSYVTYGLRLSVTRGVPCNLDSEEPNNTYALATPETLGDLFGKTICPGDVDWYQVAARRGQTVTAELDATQTDGEIDFALIDSDGQKQLAVSSSGMPAQTLSTTSFSGSKVYVKVYGADPTIQNTYDLHLRVQ